MFALHTYELKSTHYMHIHSSIQNYLNAHYYQLFTSSLYKGGTLLGQSEVAGPLHYTWQASLFVYHCEISYEDINDGFKILWYGN